MPTVKCILRLYKLCRNVLLFRVILGLLIVIESTSGGWEKLNDACVNVVHNGEKSNYNDAKGICINENSSLLEIHSLEFLEEIESIKEVKDKHYWIGAEYTNDDYTWSNGEKIDQQLWKNGEPHTEGQCVIYTKNKLRVRNCDHPERYICQKDTVSDLYINCSTRNKQVENCVLGKNYTVNTRSQNLEISNYAVDGDLLCTERTGLKGNVWQFDLGQSIFVKEIHIYTKMTAGARLSVYISHGLDVNGNLLTATKCSEYKYTPSEKGLNILPIQCDVPVGRFIRLEVNRWRFIERLCEIEIYGYYCFDSYKKTCNDVAQTYITLNDSTSMSFGATQSMNLPADNTQMTSSLLSSATTITPYTETANTGKTGNGTICYCTCDVLKLNQNVTDQELQQEIREIVKGLTIEAKTTNKAQRKLISTKDKRQSAQTIGYVGIILLSFTFGGIILPDTARTVRSFYSIVRE